MKVGILAFLLCYVTLPVAFFCGSGLLAPTPVGVVPLLYYALLVFGLLRLSRLPSPARYMYRLALLVVALHLAFLLALAVVSRSGAHWDRTREICIVGLLFSIGGVYVVACLAGAVLAWGRGLRGHAALQLLGPAYLSSCYFLPSPLSNSPAGTALGILAFFGQGGHACWLGLGLLSQQAPPPSHDIGLNPA